LLVIKTSYSLVSQTWMGDDACKPRSTLEPLLRPHGKEREALLASQLAHSASLHLCRRQVPSGLRRESLELTESLNDPLGTRNMLKPAPPRRTESLSYTEVGRRARRTVSCFRRQIHRPPLPSGLSLPSLVCLLLCLGCQLHPSSLRARLACTGPLLCGGFDAAGPKRIRVASG